MRHADPEGDLPDLLRAELAYLDLAVEQIHRIQQRLLVLLRALDEELGG